MVKIRTHIETTRLTTLLGSNRFPKMASPRNIFRKHHTHKVYLDEVNSAQLIYHLARDPRITSNLPMLLFRACNQKRERVPITPRATSLPSQWRVSWDTLNNRMVDCQIFLPSLCNKVRCRLRSSLTNIRKGNKAVKKRASHQLCQWLRHRTISPSQRPMLLAWRLWSQTAWIKAMKGRRNICKMPQNWVSKNHQMVIMWPQRIILVIRLLPMETDRVHLTSLLKAPAKFCLAGGSLKCRLRFTMSWLRKVSGPLANKTVSSNMTVTRSKSIKWSAMNLILRKFA